MNTTVEAKLFFSLICLATIATVIIVGIAASSTATFLAITGRFR
ncbi:MAG: hypothetical protein PWP75_1315 [Caldanaerobacter sp.]|nr:hypothetical protein [Caldanaerobacter sp.]